MWQKKLFQEVISVYKPSAIVLQCGADSLNLDRLGRFNLSHKVLSFVCFALALLLVSLLLFAHQKATFSHCCHPVLIRATAAVSAMSSTRICRCSCWAVADIPSEMSRVRGHMKRLCFANTKWATLFLLLLIVKILHRTILSVRNRAVVSLKVWIQEHF